MRSALHPEEYVSTWINDQSKYTNTYGDFGLKQSVKAGDHALASYAYDVEGKSFLLTQLSYGNGNSVAYEYDDLDRILAVRYDGETNPGVEYLYDNMGSATLRKDNITQVQTKQLYDFADRLCRIEEKGMGSNALDHTYEWTYDQRDNVASITETLNGASWEIAFTYNADDILTQTTYGTNAFANAFDTLGRQTQRTHTVSGTTRMTTTYGYLNPDSAHTTTLLSTVRNQGTQFDKTTAYTYDDRGNITSVTANGSTTTYAYDNLGQLTRENNQAAGKTWTWTYDTAGNILSKSEYAYTTGSLGTALDTVTYGYADSRGWGDLLTSYDGRSFQYDEIGNLLSDGEWTYTWSKGRQLASMSKPGSALTFTYDADGNRITKTVNGTTTTYTYVDGRVTHETNGTDTIHYRYDTNGTLLSMNLNGTEYYYLYNGQRDVIGLYDASGKVVVEYTYDAWGRPLTTTGSLASTVGAKNPYRYRSYPYDTENGLYHLRSRYYSPEVERFLNGDSIDNLGVSGTVTGYSMFSYCENNPVKYVDSEGKFICAITGAIAGAITGGISAWLDSDPNDPNKLEKIFATAALGAATGALAGICADFAIATGGVGGVIIAAAGGAAAGVINYVGTQGINDQEIDGGDLAISAVFGAVTNLLTMGMGAGPGTKATDRTWQGICKQMQKNSLATIYGVKSGSVRSNPKSILKKPVIIRAAKSVTRESVTSTVISGFGSLYSKAANKITRGLK